MAIIATDPYRGVCRISRAKFAQVLRERAAPTVLAERPAEHYWDALTSNPFAKGLDPLFVLAMFAKESSMGKNGTAIQTKSWGNTRLPNFGPTPVLDATGKIVEIAGRSGTFPQHANWLNGMLTTGARLMAATYYYRKENRTIGQVFNDPLRRTPPIEWAPAGDLNNPAGYLATMLTLMNEWTDQAVAFDAQGNLPASPGTPITPTGGIMAAPKIALAAGHHNSDGGNAFEIQQTGPLTQAIAAHCKRLGMDVRVLTPDGPDADTLPGDGTFAGGIWDVAKAAVALATQGWVPDAFIEVHTEGAGQGVRGVFTIYPDWPAASDTDTDVRDTLGPAISRKVAAAVGGTVRGNGVMSEKNTGVGLSGYRLGIFNLSAPLKATTSRMIVEYFSHDDTQDLALANAPGFADKCGKATAEALAQFYGWTTSVPGTEPPVVAQGNTNPAFDTVTQVWIDPAFWTYYNELGTWPVVGHPLAGSRRDADGVLRQLFENVEMELWPDGVRPRLGALGRKLRDLTAPARQAAKPLPETVESRKGRADLRALTLAFMQTGDDYGDPSICRCMHASDCQHLTGCWCDAADSLGRRGGGMSVADGETPVVYQSPIPTHAPSNSDDGGDDEPTN